MTSKNKAEQYLSDVLAGRVVTNRLVKLACERHQHDLKDGPARGLRFDAARGQHVIDFIERYVPGTEGEHKGKPWVLEPWIAALLHILYGWVWSGTGRRRFKVAYVEVSRGNLKSTIASALALYELISVPGANVYSASTDKETAKVVFTTSVRMRDLSPALEKRVVSFRNNLHVPGAGSKFEPCSAEAKTLFHASRPSFVVLDELHLHPTPDVWNAFWSTLEKRPEAWILAITNSGWDRHSICYRQREYTIKVLQGIIPDDSRFGWITGLDEEDYKDVNGWLVEKNWIKANPSLGHAVSLDGLRRQAMQAKNDPSALNEFLRFYLGIWTESHSVWMPMEAWDACKEPVDAEALKGRKCFVGMDLSSTTDTTAVVMLFPPAGDDKLWRVIPHIFVPEDNLPKRIARDKVPYGVWQRAGFLTLTPGNIIDTEFVRAKINEIAQDYSIVEIGFDKAFSADLTPRLQDDGFTLVSIHPGEISQTPPLKKLMELVLRKEFAHGGNPVLRWMVSNLVVRIGATGLMKPDKEKSRERIDGISALLDALARAILVPVADANDFGFMVI